MPGTFHQPSAIPHPSRLTTSPGFPGSFSLRISRARRPGSRSVGRSFHTGDPGRRSKFPSAICRSRRRTAECPRRNGFLRQACRSPAAALGRLFRSPCIRWKRSFSHHAAIVTAAGHYWLALINSDHYHRLRRKLDFQPLPGPFESVELVRHKPVRPLERVVGAHRVGRQYPA